MLPKNFLIGQRIALGFALPLLALLAVGFATLRSLENMQEESSWVSHTTEVMAELGNFNSALSAIESSGRGYVITGDEHLKDALISNRLAATRALQHFRTLTADNVAQVERADLVRALIEKRANLSQELITLRDSGKGAGDARIVQVVRDGQKISDELRAHIEQLLRIESELLLQRREKSRDATSFARSTVLYGSAASFLLVAVVGLVLSRSITRPLANLRQSAQRLGEGDYAHRVVGERDDEIGHLGAVFNRMGAQVQERQAALAAQDWLKSSLARFVNATQQQRDPVAVCRALLSEFAENLGVHRSTIYRVTPGVHEALELTASFAAENPTRTYTAGQGLVGQCLLEKKRHVLTDAPPEYLRIHSSLGAAKPAVVLVEPVFFEGRLKAVLELAAFERFTPLQLELIGQCAAHLGVVLQTIEAIARTEDLLREAQALSAKLSEQQRSLADKNQELETQAVQLRQSEQLLQEQQVELTQTNEELEQSNEELQQSNEEMEEKSNLLAQQKRELEHSNREIEQARVEVQEQARQLSVTSKYKSDFLATMSHELRTPLNSLLILARLLRENRDGNLSTKQIEFAQTIESSGADLLEMINQILDLAKIESGTVEVQVESVVPSELVRVLEQQFRAVADGRKLTLDFALAPELPAVVQTDGRRLMQILRNLMANAFKFTERGGVALEVRLVSGGWNARHDFLAQAPAVVAFAVRDSGIGVAKEKQELIFGAFQQADGGTARRFGGTGLGLAISRELAHLLGGAIELESEAGRGSTFTLFLPTQIDPNAPRPAPRPATLATAPRTAPTRQAATETPLDSSGGEDVFDGPAIPDDRDAHAPGDRLLLVIEDDLRFARILVDFAREQRFKAIVARSAREGFALALKHLPVAITLDLRLVDEDGWVVLDRLKHDRRTRHIPVHVISVDPARGRGLRLGAVSYLQKPVSKEAIQEVLQRTIEFVERPTKNLLVVEDDPVQRSTICELIGNGDVHTTAVGSAAEALAQLRTGHFDCVVLDLMLPDKPGVELIREMNAALGTQTPPVIVYTGKELSPREETELRSLSESIIVKDARSPERLLDETALFLHRVEARLPEAKRRMLEQVRKQDTVLTGRNVLVVDDDARNIFALTAALETYGMNVRFAESGRSAIEQLRKDPHCDIVLMDVMMPEMDGHEAIRQLRKDSRFAKLPIISLTAKAMKGDRERCIEAGASDYITKPVDTEKLLSLLRVWLYR